MDFFSHPSLLFFIIGIILVQFKGDLILPAKLSKFVSTFLLLCIGFRGGQELAHGGFGLEVSLGLLLGIVLALGIPLIAFLILRSKFSTENAGAIAASYGSVSTVTFITAASFLELQQVSFSGHMIAVMAIMEAPAIIVGTFLIKRFSNTSSSKTSMKEHVWTTLTQGSVLLILGSLIIGILSSSVPTENVASMASYVFKGFLAIFLLDMGLISGRQISLLVKQGLFPFLFSGAMPFFHGLTALLISRSFTTNDGDQLLFAILAASASYIAVPAAMRNIAPKANPALYLPMALGITFPINILFGIPFYSTTIHLLNSI